VEYYDEIIRGNGYDIDAEVSFLSEIMRDFWWWKNVLEFACGTWTIACELEKKGFMVTWVDLSEQMIVKSGRDDFFVWDMTNYQLWKKFDIVLCNYNSVCHLPDGNSWNAFFQNAYNHLDEWGILIFDILTLFEFGNISRDFRGFFQCGKDTVCLEMFQEPGKDVFSWLIKMFVHQWWKNYELVEEKIREISFEISKIQTLLKSVGFSVTHMEDFHFGEVTDESERVYFVMKK
jgi:SAM-dependent methyltransferase